MIRRLIGTLLLVSLAVRPAGAQAELPPVEPRVPCASMRSFDPRLPEAPTRVAEAREAGIEGKRTCFVQGYVSPQIRFEVRLPLQGWTQRYLQTGCGGLCGRLSIQAPQRPCPALQRGEFVTASTDMGHQGGGGTWGASDPQLRVDFAYRGVHLTAVVAKAIIAEFYGQGPRWSYFSGCSDGGREGMMEAQRYPEDFDGIAAGAPALLRALLEGRVRSGIP
jgi:feruloyl esterase